MDPDCMDVLEPSYCGPAKEAWYPRETRDGAQSGYRGAEVPESCPTFLNEGCYRGQWYLERQLTCPLVGPLSDGSRDGRRLAGVEGKTRDGASANEVERLGQVGLTLTGRTYSAVQAGVLKPPSPPPPPP